MRKAMAEETKSRTKLVIVEGLNFGVRAATVPTDVPGSK